MQYESIILELMSRIKVLESDVSSMKKSISTLESILSLQEIQDSIDKENFSPVNSQNSTSPTSYTKTTDQMIYACYKRGKEAYQNPHVNIWSLADNVAQETGMNRNSAFMYIHAVKNMLGGTVFKRAVNAKALRYYFEAIYQDYGADGLRTAISSVRKNISYRQHCGLPYASISSICEEYERKLV